MASQGAESQFVTEGCPVAPADSEPLTVTEVKRLVESAQPAVALNDSSDKGRILVARRPLKPGEVVVREVPLFKGATSSKQCRQIFTADFLALIDDEDREELHEDALDPESPLMDCISSIILSKHKAVTSKDKADAARETLRLRQMDALCYTSKDSVPESAPEDIFELLQPDFQKVTSTKEIYRMLHIMSSNRFGTNAGNMECHFAGSFFEHSCAPNCFHGTWDGDDSKWTPKSFRALRELSEGEALSIDYLLLPDAYAPTKLRQQELSKWSFECTCERCTTLPELTRAFICPACKKGELCLASPQAEDKMICLSCFTEADAETVTRYLLVEAEFIEDHRPVPMRGHDVVSRYHWLSFVGAWRHFMNPEAFSSVPRRANIHVCHLLVDCISRLYGSPKYPYLVEIYNELAKLYGSDDLDNQSYFLAMEHEALEASYPEECLKQDKEAMGMCQRQGPPSKVVEEIEAEGGDVMNFTPPTPSGQIGPAPADLTQVLEDAPVEDGGATKSDEKKSHSNRPALVFGGAAAKTDHSDLSGMD